MKKHLAVSLALLLSSSLAYAVDERVFSLDSQGDIYELKFSRGMMGFGSGGTMKWEKVPQTELTRPDFRVDPDARVSSSGLVEVKQASGSYSDSGLRPPPGSIQYSQAVADSQGNVAVRLGGTGRGFNYLPSGRGPILANRMEWSPSPLPADPSFIHTVPGDNAFLVVAGGKVYRVEPPAGARRSFDWEVVPGLSDVETLHTVQGRVVAVGANGSATHLNNISSSAAAARLSPVELPDRQPFQAVTSNLESPSIFLTKAERARTPAPAPVVAAAQAVIPTATPAAAPAPAAKPAAPKGNPPEKIENAWASPQGLSDDAKAFLKGTDTFFNDDLAQAEWKGQEIQFIGRDKEADQVIDTLARMKGRNPVLLGEPGTGKTTVAEMLAEMIRKGKLPPGPAFDELRDAVVVQTSAGKISSLARSNDNQAQQAAMESYMKGLRELEEKSGRKIVLYVDEMHNLSEPQLQALKPYLDSSSKGIHFLGSTTNNEYGRLIKDDDAFRRRLQPVAVDEFNEEDTFKVLKQAWVPKLEQKYNVKISDEAIRAAVREAPVYNPTSHRPEAPFKLLQDVSVAGHRKAQGQVHAMADDDVFNHIVKAQNSPLNPYDREAFNRGIETLRDTMRETVIEQELVTDAMVDEWRKINQGVGRKKHRSILVAGPTGSGKTFSAQTFAKQVLGGEQRMLEIDATRYSTGGLSLNSLLGAPNGIESSDKTAGLLPEFLDGRGRGQNVIVINEIDKAHPDFMKAIMELLDTGKLQAGNGKTYHLGKSLIVFTTNKGDDQIYPRGRKALSRKELKERMANIGAKEIRGYFMQSDSKNLYDHSRESPASVLQRIDRAVPAAPPSAEGATKVMLQQAEKFSKEFETKYGVKVALDPESARKLVDVAYFPEDGVREIVRLSDDTLTKAVEQLEKSGSLPRGSQVNVKIEGNEDGSRFVASVEGSPRQAAWEAKLLRPEENPLADQETRKLYENLTDNLKKHVMGQDDMVESISRSLRAKAVNYADPKPAVALFLGPTGTGKSELGKVVARERYGAEDKLISFNMGEVKWEGDMNNIFGAARGIQGGSEMAPFERFLNDHANGGVIMFDEIGNMGGGRTNHGGGGGASSKEDMLKRFYQMLDEGSWRSPSGRVYDLKKFNFVFTSNEGQEIFNQLPTDDLRLQAWRGGKSPENLMKVLKKHGWPEALVARFGGNISLAKPLLKEERMAIAKKFTDKAIKQMQDQHKFRSVKVSPDFYEAVASTFFSHEEGARKMGSVANQSVAALIGDAVFKLQDYKNVKNMDIELKLDDNFAGKVKHAGFETPQRRVALSLTGTSPEGTIRVSSDLTNKASAASLKSKIDAARIAYHEAGHAVVNDAAKTGMKLEHVTIHSAGGMGGYASFNPVPGKQSFTRDEVAAKIGSMVAGRLVEMRRGFLKANTGWTADLEEARKLAQKAVTEWGLGSNPMAMPTNDGKVAANHPTVQKEIQDLLAEGEAYARKRIDAKWSEIRAVADALYKKGSLGEEEFNRLAKVVPDAEGGTAARSRGGRTRAPISECPSLYGAIPTP